MPTPVLPDGVPEIVTYRVSREGKAMDSVRLSVRLFSFLSFEPTDL